jgi:tetratricopeptide (TPR) repeat protein
MNDKARSLLEAARRELARRKLKKAARLMEQAVEADPDAHELLAERAAMAITPLREYRKAVDDLTRALGLVPGNGGYYDMRGQAYWYLREYERALEDFNKAIEVDAACASAYYHRGNFYDKLQRYEQAIQDMLRAVELDSENRSYKRRLDELKRTALRSAERLGEEPPAIAMVEPQHVEPPEAAEEPVTAEEPELAEAEPEAPTEEPAAPATEPPITDELEAPSAPAQTPAAEAAAVEPAIGLWSVRIPTGETFGPVSMEVLKLWARELRVKAQDKVRRPDGAWRSAREVAELAAIFEELRTIRKPPVRPD